MLNQLDLHRQDQSSADVEEFGDSFSPPAPNTIRLCFQNLNNVPASRLTFKSRQVIDFFLQSSAGVFGFAETGLYWPKVPEDDSWYERTFGKFRQCKSQLAYNTTEASRTELHHNNNNSMIRLL